MKKKVFIIVPILVALLTFLFVYRYYNKESKETSLNVNDRTYVEKNKDKVIDLEVMNNYPLYGENGEGVFFDFINDFEKNVGLEFNKIPYLKESKPTTNGYRIRMVNGENNLTDKDLLIFEDFYIALGKTYQRINNVKDLKNQTLGIFADDKERVAYYLKSAPQVTYKTYNSIDEMIKALDNDEVSMLIIPNIMNLDKTIDSKYSINYYFTELSKKTVLTLGDNKELNKIITKYFNRWKETKYVKEYNKEYFDYYKDVKKISAKDNASLVSKTYTYGYVTNYPYEVMKGSSLRGIAAEYVNRLNRFTNIEFKFKKYNSVKSLEKAVKNGDVDVYFDYYNINDDKYRDTISTFVEDYVVLAPENTNYIVNSFESLKNKQITMIGENSLYNYFNNNSNSKIKKVKSVEDLKNAKTLVVVDREVYNYYKNKYFKKFNVLYIDTMMNDYKFMVKKDNKDFYNLFNYIINTNSYYNYRSAGLESLNASILEDETFTKIYFIILLVVFIPLVIALLIYLRLNFKHKKKIIKKIDKHKYTDILTSLKNRNYLNDKMPEWQECKVYPQAIVIVDLNNVKYVNDNYGHAAGDDLIIKAASTLVNTQLENSEIIRTDGNEFLIYLVGYSTKQIDTYTKKLAKELKTLPHEFGAGVGYSMIEDDIKTIDDAINEATIDMISSKNETKK